MTRTTATGPGSDARLVQASECWVQAFGVAPLAPQDASDLVESAQKIVQTVARAARRLDWRTPDSFIVAMRQAERSSDC